MKKLTVLLLCLFAVGLFSYAFAVDEQAGANQSAQQETEQSQTVKEAKVLPSTLITDDEAALVSLEEEEFSYSYADDEYADYE